MYLYTCRNKTPPTFGLRNGTCRWTTLLLCILQCIMTYTSRYNIMYTYLHSSPNTGWSLTSKYGFLRFNLGLIWFLDKRIPQIAARYCGIGTSIFLPPPCRYVTLQFAKYLFTTQRPRYQLISPSLRCTQHNILVNVS